MEEENRGRKLLSFDGNFGGVRWKLTERLTILTFADIENELNTYKI